MVLLASACSALLIVCLFIKRHPSISPDEYGFIFNGQRLIGHRQLPLDEASRSFYMAGYGFITGVAAFIGRSTGAQFTISLIFNMVFVVCTFLVLRAFSRRHLALSDSWAIVVSVAACLMPAIAANSLFSWSESLNRLAFTLLVFLVFELAQKPTWRLSVPIALLGAWMPIIHGRFTLIVPMLLVLFIFVGLSSENARRIASISAIAIIVFVYALFRSVNTWLKHEMYPASLGQEGRVLRKLIRPGYYSDIMRGLTSQGWYLASTSLGVAVVGIFALVLMVPGRLKNWRKMSWLGPVFTLVLASALLLTCSLQLLFVVRPDHLAYGRYSEVILPIFIVSGFSLLIHNGAAALKYWWCGLGAVVLFCAMLVIGTGGDNLHTRMSRGEFFEIGNGIGLGVPVKLLPEMGYISVTLLVVALGAIITVIAKKNLGIAVAVFSTIALFCTAFTVTRSILPRRDYAVHLKMDNVIRDISTNNSSVTIGFDASTDVFHQYFVYRFLLDPVQLQRVETGVSIPAGISCVIGTAEQSPGAQWQQVSGAAERGLVLWKLQEVDSC